MNKKQLFLLFTIMSVITFISCEKEDTPFLNLVSSEKIGVYEDPFESTITFNCNTAWKATVDVPWCNIANTNNGEGNGTNQTLHIVGGINPTTKMRTAVISIQAGGLQKDVILTQTAGASKLTIHPTFISADSKEDVYSIIVTSNSQWDATINDATINDWCTITPNSGFGSAVITVSVARNHGYARRHAFISIVSGEIQKTDTIFQNGGESYSDPSIAVTINNLVWAARNVDVFGNFTDFSTQTGKYYKFNGTTGYSYIGENVVPAFYPEIADDGDWLLINDPCPCEWRLPTAEELESLRASGYRWVDDLAGAWLGPDAESATLLEPGNAIFFPANGILAENVVRYPEWGCYWTKTHVRSGSELIGGRTFMFSKSFAHDVTTRYFTKEAALLVRCVKE